MGKKWNPEERQTAPSTQSRTKKGKIVRLRVFEKYERGKYAKVSAKSYSGYIKGGLKKRRGEDVRQRNTVLRISCRTSEEKKGEGTTQRQ